MHLSWSCLKEAVVYHLLLCNTRMVKIAASPPPSEFRSGGHQHAQRVMMSKSYFMVNVWLELEASRRSDSHTDSPTILAGSLCSSMHYGADGTSVSRSFSLSFSLTHCPIACLNVLCHHYAYILCSTPDTVTDTPAGTWKRAHTHTHTRINDTPIHLSRKYSQGHCFTCIISY